MRRGRSVRTVRLRTRINTDTRSSTVHQSCRMCCVRLGRAAFPFLRERRAGESLGGAAYRRTGHARCDLEQVGLVSAAHGPAGRRRERGLKGSTRKWGKEPE